MARPPQPATPAVPRGDFVTAILMLVLLGSLGVFTVVDMFDGPGTPQQERTAKTPPRLDSLRAAKAFYGATKHYVATRYALKESFIRINSAFKRETFEHSPYAHIILGRDGMLFLGRDAVLDGVQGADPTPGASDDDWSALFGRMEAAFAARDIPLVHLIAADKATVHPEALPAWVHPRAEPRVSTLSQRLSAELTPPVVDTAALFADVRASEATWPLYHPTDTHWTEFGAAVAIDAALDPLLEVDLTALPRKISELRGTGGDLARMIGVQESTVDISPRVERPEGLSCQTPQGSEVTIVSLDPLPTRRFTCRNPDAPGGHLLLYTDSFGMAAAPRLVQIFKTVDVIWNDRVDMDTVDEINPDMAMRIMVARKLQSERASTMLEPSQK